MADKSFYLSELALEMLVASQNEEKVIIPTAGILKKSEPTALYSELYSLVANNIVINNIETACFDINEELAPIFKSIFSSKAVLKVTECSDSNNPIYYYLAPCGIAELKNNSLRRSVGLRHLNINELADSILSDLILPTDYQNLNKDTDMFISTVDEYFASNCDCICPEMLKNNVDELKNQIEGAVGFIDLISREDLNAISRIAVYKKSVYYKIAQISIQNVIINNYSRINFNKAIETMTGEFL